jgi:hypothetical protein
MTLNDFINCPCYGLLTDKPLPAVARLGDEGQKPTAEQAMLYSFSNKAQDMDASRLGSGELWLYFDDVEYYIDAYRAALQSSLNLEVRAGRSPHYSPNKLRYTVVIELPNLAFTDTDGAILMSFHLGRRIGGRRIDENRSGAGIRFVRHLRDGFFMVQTLKNVLLDDMEDALMGLPYNVSRHPLTNDATNYFNVELKS